LVSNHRSQEDVRQHTTRDQQRERYRRTSRRIIHSRHTVAARPVFVVAICDDEKPDGKPYANEASAAAWNAYEQSATLLLSRPRHAVCELWRRHLLRHTGLLLHHLLRRQVYAVSHLRKRAHPSCSFARMQSHDRVSGRTGGSCIMKGWFGAVPGGICTVIGCPLAMTAIGMPGAPSGGHITCIWPSCGCVIAMGCCAIVVAATGCAVTCCIAEVASSAPPCTRCASSNGVGAAVAVTVAVAVAVDVAIGCTFVAVAIGCICRQHSGQESKCCGDAKYTRTCGA
jgi:hypothetical protein